MTRNRQFQLGGRNPAAVIRHLDQFFSRLFDRDRDGPGPGIQGVFQELLHHGRGALDHLSGGDLGRHF